MKDKLNKLKEFIIKNNKILLLVIGILLVLTIGISYAYYSNTGKQSEYNTFTSGCLSITITEESDSISLTKAVPTTIEEGLKSKPYTFTIKNNCSTSALYQVGVESIDKTDNTMSLDNIRVSLEDSEGRVTTERLDRLDTTLISNDNAYDARKMYNGDLEGNSTTNFKFRMWLDYDATKESAVGKTYKNQIVISAKDNITKDNEIFGIAFEEISKVEAENGWHSSYITKVSITDTKDNNISAKYCVSNTKCTPDTDIELIDNSFTYEYPNGENMLCVIASDSLGNSSKITCSNIIKKDNEAPNISIGSTSSTSNSITINVNAIDSESKISTYYYKLNDGEYESGTSSSKTYTGLSSGTSYTIYVYAKDNAGNTSDEIKFVIFTASLLNKTRIISNQGESKGKYNSTDSFTEIATSSDTGIYETEDDYGTSYYFRGLEGSLNNWVEFAGFYWRIIRINGNGSIRMIYSGVANGKPSNANKTGATTQINNTFYKYNHTYNDNAYVGYMMGIPLNGLEPDNTTSSHSSNYNTAHTNTYDSDVKKAVDSWYSKNLISYTSKIDTEAGFCNDRVLSKGTGYGETESDYAASKRLLANSNQKPTLKCINKERDLFTVSNAKSGNKALTYPIGLITADEVVYAGGLVYRDNTTYYLYTNQDYWTMSPDSYNSINARILYVMDTGSISLGGIYVTGNRAIRPIINIKENLFATGIGSETNPYKVVGAE